ncbi:hypothetical protein AB664_01075, partial [Brucella anthropi]
LVFSAPLKGHFKAASPYSAFLATGGSFSAAIVAIGNRPALFHHPLVEIRIAQIATSEISTIFIKAFFFTPNRGFADSDFQRIAGISTAGIVTAFDPTGLLHLRCVDTEKADMYLI